jgi:ABC-2 type transport system permease protein
MTAPTLATLVRVELRKSCDTRAGRWLLITLGLLALGVVVLLLFAGSPGELNFEAFLLTAQLPMGIFLPVIGIIAVTSEWSQRTALTTFTLVPRRSRIMVAKIVALTLLALVAVVISIATAALGNVIAEVTREADGSWGSASTLAGVALFQVLCVLVGVGVGMLLLSAPQAIVVYLLLPFLLSSLADSIHALENVSRWISLLDTITLLLGEQLTGTAWARIATSVALWSLLPMLIGSLRIQRREVQ